MNSTKYWVWLSMVFGTGSRRIWDVMHLFEYAGYAYHEITRGYLSGRLNDNERRNANHIKLEQAEEHIEYCRSLGINVIGYGDSEYPEQLRNIYNPPAVLYYKGELSCLSSPITVTSVGTRRASVYSLNTANRICRELAAKGAVIISGFAVGIDIASHLAAAYSGHSTVCVMGCGLDIDYPKDNYRYREIILKNHGAFVSEYPPGTPPHSQNFPKRNRILAALGRAALVFEASDRSGSLITAGLALEQGKEIFCLPPADIFSGSFSGNISLLRDGANALYSADDVLECFECEDSADDENYDDENINYSSEEENKPVSATHEISNNKSPKRKKTAEASPESYDSLTPVQQKIMALFSDGAVHADELAQKLEADSGNDDIDIMSELTELELFGIIKSLPGKFFEKA